MRAQHSLSLRVRPQRLYPRHRSWLPGPCFDTDRVTLITRLVSVVAGLYINGCNLSGHSLTDCIVSGTFHFHSWVLFNIPSRYYMRYRSLLVFSFGDRFPPTSRGLTGSRYSGYPKLALSFRLRDYHPLRSTIPDGSPIESRLVDGVHNTTSPDTFMPGFGLNCSAFARRYSRNRNCFLFLCLLGCFASAGSPALTGTLHKKRDCHSEISGSTFTCNYPELIAACHVLHRLKSRVIHYATSVYGHDFLFREEKTLMCPYAHSVGSAGLKRSPKLSP